MLHSFPPSPEFTADDVDSAQSAVLQTNEKAPSQSMDSATRSSVTVTAAMPFHSVDEAFDSELAELARLRVECLVLLCRSGKGKEGGDLDGVVMVGSYGS